jgi:hypothetical protein
MQRPLPDLRGTFGSMSPVANAARLLVIAATVVAAAASSSNQGERAAAPGPDPAAPASQPMDPALALGLWKTSFGPVKIEADETGGPSSLVGVWTYDKNGQQVVGYFQGALEGNVLRFSWHEPAQPADLVGDGYLVFDVQGRTFAGRWWTRARDNGGEWNGWRAPGAGEPGAPALDGGPAPAEPERGEAEQAPPDTI